MVVQRSGVVALTVVGLVAIVGYVGFLAWAAYYESYNVWGSMIWVPVMIVASFPLLAGVAGRQRDGFIRKVIWAAFLAKVLASFARFYIAYVTYHGQADAQTYNLYAAYHYMSWRQGIFVIDNDGGALSTDGTYALKLITTALYTVIGPAPIAAFVVMAIGAFWGSYWLLRAFQLALPGFDDRRFAVLLLFLPSMLYWPASLGKEAWLLPFVGLFALGLAKVLTDRILGGPLLMLAGLAGIIIVRPHLAVLLVAAAVGAIAFRPTRTGIGLIAKAIAVLVMVAAGWYVWSQTLQLLSTTGTVGDDLSSTLAQIAERTDEGGSAFTPVPITSPFGVPAAIITVLFRPFPWEADNLQMMLAAVESSGLLVLLVVSFRRLRQLPRLLRTTPYLVFSLLYVALFIVAFSAFSNFGILARQRVLMLPFFLLLVSLPAVARRKRRLDADEELEERVDVTA